MSSSRALLKAAAFALPIALSACVKSAESDAMETPDTATAAEGTTTASSKAPPIDMPPMRWDHRPEADAWNASAVAALRSHGAALPSVVPADIETWCPGYSTASLEDREAFWVGLLSTLAKHESTWNPSAVGGGGLWFGLVQIAPPTANGYGCNARSGSALKNGSDNLSCAIRIMAHTVMRDGVVSQGMRGVAADWGPFHSSSKRADMIAWTRTQPFCQAKPQTVRARMLERLRGEKS